MFTTGCLIDAHLQLCQPFTDLLYPHVSADSQRLRYRLAQRFRGHLNDVFGGDEIATGDQAGTDAITRTRRDCNRAALVLSCPPWQLG